MSPAALAAHATISRTQTCPHCQGEGEILVAVPGGVFDAYQHQWYPHEYTYPCVPCKGQGTFLETFCLRCDQDTEDCFCTDEQIEAFLILGYLGAA